LQFFDGGFKPTNPSAQLYHFVVKEQSALSGFQLSPLKVATAAQTPLPIATSLRRARRQRDRRLGLSRDVPRGYPELPRQAQGRLQLEALDVTHAHLARCVSRDPEYVAEFGVIQTPNELFKALAEAGNCHRVRIPQSGNSFLLTFIESLLLY